MTGNFGDAAARLWGVASSLLGWRPDEFWRSTPAELAMALTPEFDAVDPPSRDAIEQLRRRFPDQ